METATYNVNVTLSTEAGELLTIEETRQLIEDQMSGTLDEYTGLQCIGVTIEGMDPFDPWRESERG